MQTKLQELNRSILLCEKNGDISEQDYATYKQMLEILTCTRNALRRVLPYLPADGAAVYCGEWLDEVNEFIGEA